VWYDSSPGAAGGGAPPLGIDLIIRPLFANSKLR
jgi:hypothetical protein